MQQTIRLFLFFFLCFNLFSSFIYADISDSTGADAYYFVSNRDAKAGYYSLYKARTNNSGISSCLLRGNFEVKDFPHMRKAEITVYNLSNDKLAGIYNTNPVTGNYLIILMPNVKYEFVINTYGYAPIRKVVEIPHYASTNVNQEISTQKMMLNIDSTKVDVSLNTWIVEDKEPTIFLLTVYNENVKNIPEMRLYEASKEEFDEITERDRRTFKETTYEDIDDLLKKQAEIEQKKPIEAEKAFKAKQYKKAINLYTDLLKLNPNNEIANYRKGVSIFYAENNKLKALPYLKKALNKPKTPYMVHYYLGKVYHLWSDFDKAHKQLLKFQKKATPKELTTLQIPLLINYCVNGKKLIADQLNMEVENKTSIDVKKLPKGYPEYLLGDKMKKKTAFFISPIDEKKNEDLTMFKSEHNEMIQTSYGLDGKNAKDLYINYLLGGDKWSLSKPLGNHLNTSSNEDYAYITPDGLTLYFSSEGHNSIGGYDIFMSTRTSITESWSEPKNIGYPINSPYDDILFVPDNNDEFAYFSSNRRSPSGGFNMYKIKIPKPPLPLTIIKGHFMTSDSIPNFSASIAVYNTNNQEIVGIYNTNVNTGKYLMALMPGIKYEFAILSDGFNEHLAYVTVPVQTEPYPLKQNIKLKKEGAFEILNIDNYFTKEEAENVPEFTLTRQDFEKKIEQTKTKVISRRVKGKSTKPTPQQLQILNSAKQFYKNAQYLKSIGQYAKVDPILAFDDEHAFYYGASMYHTSKNYEKMLPYLEQAALNKNTPTEVFYMLGQANHYAYRFERAVKAYERYVSYASEKEVEKKDVATQLELCKYGKKITNNPKPVEVLSKKDFKKSDLHRIYGSTDVDAKFLLAPEDMTSSLDKKNNHQPIMYLNKNKTLILLSSYGENDASNKDLFMLKKLPNNTWSEPISLGEKINSNADEDYPYLTPDGNTLYFASKRKGSMGGFDIFKSTWNSKTSSWNSPENLGTPINSPFDDLLYVE